MNNRGNRGITNANRFEIAKLNRNQPQQTVTHRCPSGMAVMPDFKGAIAKIGEKYFALGIGKEEIHVIAELKKDDLKLPDQMVDATVEKTPKMSFKEVLANMKGNAKDDNEK